MRMLSNSASSLQNLVFDYWAKIRGESKKKDAGNKKALRMMANSSQAIVLATWGAWKGARENQGKKDANTARAVRMINASSEALQASAFQAWAKDVRTDRDKNRKIRALEKSFGAQDKGCKMVVFTGWQSFAKIEGRKKRAKEHSMKSAIKSITGNADLLLCQLMLAWARYASGDRSEKLEKASKDVEEALQTAVEQARVAVEEDLARAQAEVDSIKKELEEKKKEKDEVIGTLEGLQSSLEETATAVHNFDRQISTIAAELEHSRRKAKDIGEELSKVGIFITAHQPRKQHRSGSGNGSRPQSGRKVVDEKLPPIDGRPGSGSKMDGSNGSKSARGVSGERGATARSGSGRALA